MPPFLLDANLSPETRAFLVASFNLDVTDLVSLGLSHMRDVDVVELAKREGRVIITFDLDLGEIYHRKERGRLGVTILRLADQTIESVNNVLRRFFQTQAATIPLERSLIVVDESRIRVVSEP
jgi:predicted nuclease of predicted toxin-antitoxin system